MLDKVLDGPLLEAALNQALKLDPQAAEKLAPLEGKTIAITLDMRDKPWVLRVNQGRFSFDDDTANQVCDVRLRGSLSGFLRLFDQSGRGHGVNDKLYIEGDLHSAQQFQRVMAELSSDFDVVLKRRFGERLGGAFSAGLEQLRAQGEQAKASIEVHLQQYFAGEDGQCVTREDHLTFQQGVSALRLTLDRLEARIKKLES